MTKARASSFLLPTIAELERRARIVAFLDAAIEPDVGSRAFDFDASWARGQRLFTARSGEGDEVFVWFGKAGALVRGVHQGGKRVEASRLFAGLPRAFEPQRKEPAFDVGGDSFALWCEAGTPGWRWGVEPRRLPELLRVLDGKPRSYCAHARVQHGVGVREASLRALHAGGEVTPAWIAEALGPDIDVDHAMDVAASLGLATRSPARSGPARVPRGGVRHGGKVLVPDATGRLADAEYRVVRDGDEVLLVVNGAVQMSAVRPGLYVETIEAVRAVLRSAGNDRA